MKRVSLRFGILFALVVTVYGLAGSGLQPVRGQNVTDAEVSPRLLLDQYCVACHNQSLMTAGLALDELDLQEATDNADIWEGVIRKLRTRAMPPAGMPRPDEQTYEVLAGSLETLIDQDWQANPNPGRINSVHRLNRTEYNNAIRDLLALDVDVRPLLPGDETADGSFDNMADALSVTTTHLERYMTVARQVSRLAVGLPPQNAEITTYEVPLHIEQDVRLSEDLPLGSRGGTAVEHQFPVDGEYLIKVVLRRNYQQYLVGMGWQQQVDVRLDGELVERFTVGEAPEGARPATRSHAGAGFGDREWEDFMQTLGDAFLQVRVPVTAGPHVVGVSFVRQMWEPEWVQQPLQRGRPLAVDERYMDYAAVGSVDIQGPFDPSGVAGETPSRAAIFLCRPQSGAAEEPCAEDILSSLARKAYRRPVADEDVRILMRFFDMGRESGETFEAGIQFALERMLVSPSFLLRVYQDPEGIRAGESYPLSDLELASRLSFFLWSSIPDDTLLGLAERGELSNPQVLEGQVRRMLADTRATDTLVSDFAAQWLNLRRVDTIVADDRFYPNYDDNLREALRQETELFIASTIREDRSVLDLLTANYTYLNQRLAEHYGIPGVYGSRYRRVLIPDMNQRGGLLGHGSLLSVSSYPDRTSPVLRGKWLLSNILGSPPPAPPPGVDTDLNEEDAGPTPRSIRLRLERHRSDPVCSSCHSVIDPLGFALENYDVIGGWRTTDEWGNPVDSIGKMPDGSEVRGLRGLRAVLLERSEAFVSTVTEKLMSYALGRRLEYYDQPAVRRVVRAAGDDYRWSSIVVGIVQSPAFTMRQALGDARVAN
jgi:mono/diheme cytochrome c family protein